MSCHYFSFRLQNANCTPSSCLFGTSYLRAISEVGRAYAVEGRLSWSSSPPSRIQPMGRERRKEGREGGREGGSGVGERVWRVWQIGFFFP